MSRLYGNRLGAAAVDVAAIAAGYMVLVGAAVFGGGMAFAADAPWQLIKSFGFQWPQWWMMSVVVGGAVPALILVSNPLRKTMVYGDSRWATKAEAKKLGLLEKEGLILGKAWGRYIRVSEPLAVVLIAPAGTGKSAGCAIPTLLSCGWSMIVNDIKGELHEITGKVRSHYGKVVRFAPADVESVRWNPLGESELPESWAEKITHIERMATLLYPSSGTEGGGTEDYFTREARALFLFYALYCLWKDGEASLPGIRALAMSTDDVQGWVADALDEGGDEVPQRIQEEGNGMLQKGDREFGSVFGSFKGGLAAFADPVVAEITGGACDFSAQAMREEVTTLYICVAKEDMERLAPLIRVLKEQFANQLLSRPWDKQNEQRITYLVDEMPQLGRLNTLVNMPATSRSYGVNAIFIAQSFAQIERIYGRIGREELLANVEFHVVYQQADGNVAKSYSSLIGTTTRKKVGLSRSMRSGPVAASKSENEEGVPFLLPQEITDLHVEDAIILRKGAYTRPVRAKQARWYQDGAMKQLHKMASRT